MNYIMNKYTFQATLSKNRIANSSIQAVYKNKVLIIYQANRCQKYFVYKLYKSNTWAIHLH